MQVRQCPDCESQNVVSTKERDGGQLICRCKDCGYHSVIANFELAEMRPKPKKPKAD